MTSSKVFLLLGLVAAIVLLISSEVAARDLAETSTENGVNDVKPDGYGGGYRPDLTIPKKFPKVPKGFCQTCCQTGIGESCCGLHIGKYCTNCCASAAETAQKAVEVEPKN